MTQNTAAEPRTVGTSQSNSRVLSVLALMALAFVLWRPVSGGELLYPALAILATVSLIRFRKPSQWMALVTLNYLTAVLIMILVGSLRDTPGLTHQATVWVGGIVIWFLWGNSMNLGNIRRVLSVIFWITIASSAAMILYVLAEKGILPQVIPSSVLERQGAGFGQNELGSEIRFYGLSTLAGAGPLAAAGAFAPRSPLLPSRHLMVGAAAFSALAVTLAGRQAILVVTLLAPIMFFAIYHALGDRRTTRLRIPVWLVVGGPAVFLVTVGIASTSVMNQIRVSLRDAAYVYAGIGTPVNESSNVRVTQAKELVSAWGEHPLFGSGLGATVDSGFARNFERPWMFELQYHQLIFNGGLVAAIFAISILGMIVVGARTAARAVPSERSTMAVVLVGALGMTAANASNPYLQAVGHWWPIALGLGVISAFLRHSAADSSSGPLPPELDQSTAVTRSPSTRQTL